MERSSFKVEDLVFGVRSSEFGVRNSEFGIRNSEFGVRSSEFSIPRSESKLSTAMQSAVGACLKTLSRATTQACFSLHKQTVREASCQQRSNLPKRRVNKSVAGDYTSLLLNTQANRQRSRQPTARQSTEGECFKNLSRASTQACF